MGCWPGYVRDGTETLSEAGTERAAGLNTDGSLTLPKHPWGPDASREDYAWRRWAAKHVGGDPDWPSLPWLVFNAIADAMGEQS